MEQYIKSMFLSPPCTPCIQQKICFATSPCISCLRDFESPQPLSVANLTSMTERSQVYFLKDKKELFFLIIFKIEVFAINEFAIYLGYSKTD